jgi:hypothetical protein
MLKEEPTSGVEDKDLSINHTPFSLTDVGSLQNIVDKSFLPHLARTQLFLEDTSQTIAHRGENDPDSNICRRCMVLLLLRRRNPEILNLRLVFPADK